MRRWRGMEVQRASKSARWSPRTRWRSAEEVTAERAAPPAHSPSTARPSTSALRPRPRPHPPGGQFGRQIRRHRRRGALEVSRAGRGWCLTSDQHPHQIHIPIRSASPSDPHPHQIRIPIRSRRGRGRGDGGGTWRCRGRRGGRDGHRGRGGEQRRR